MQYLLMSFVVMSILMSFFGKSNQIPRDEQIVNNLMSKSAFNLSKKYNMKSTGVTVGMPSGVVKLLGLEFDIIGPVSKEKIRKTLIDSSEDFLSLINNDVSIRPYLECYPFTKDKIEIVLYFDPKINLGVEHPNVGTASIRKNKLQYKTFITVDNELPKVKTRVVETEEEAIKALKEGN